MDILHSTTRRVLFLAQTLDCRDLIDPDNAPANSHAKFCRATFGDYPCSPAYFEEIYDLIRIINPDLDFEMVAVNYDRTSQFQSEKIKFWTLPFSPYAKAPLGPRKPDREALHALLSEVKMTNHHYAQKIC